LLCKCPFDIRIGKTTTKGDNMSWATFPSPTEDICNGNPDLFALTTNIRPATRIANFYEVRLVEGNPCDSLEIQLEITKAINVLFTTSIQPYSNFNLQSVVQNWIDNHSSIQPYSRFNIKTETLKWIIISKFSQDEIHLKVNKLFYLLTPETNLEESYKAKLDRLVGNLHRLLAGNLIANCDGFISVWQYPVFGKDTVL
jgi:hypothetical protein